MFVYILLARLKFDKLAVTYQTDQVSSPTLQYPMIIGEMLDTYGVEGVMVRLTTLKVSIGIIVYLQNRR